MTRGSLRLAIVVALAAIFGVTYLEETSAQKHFSHARKEHQKTTCSGCHIIPAANWPTARGFPDTTQFPGHKSCFTCHSPMAVLTGNKPTFCLECHSNVAPGRAPMLKFPVASRPTQFNIKFPHNVHQDILARVMRTDVAVAHFVNASWTRPDEKVAAFNSCAVCHVQSDKLPTVEPAAIKPELKADGPQAAEKTDAKPAFFKTMPGGHQTCFTCHYTGIKPASTDCAGCHALTAAHQSSDTLHRYSIKFDHTYKNHVTDCMVCHVRIAQNSDASAMKDPDVPVLACSTSSCHGGAYNGAKPGANDYGQSAIANEVATRKKDGAFNCTYCHSPAIGRNKVPPSHVPPPKTSK
ncbi:MAG TPA: hypothetical protein VL501_06860 [Pyrinomonadaceae bacterium]|nr:hypothetical protein [Pyrinomonadaceae bacterium]